MEDASSTESRAQLIRAAVFSSWSYTMGPQMVYMWLPGLPAQTDTGRTLASASQCQTRRKTKRGTFAREVEDLTSQLLHGELHGESTPCNRSKVFVLPAKNLVLHSRVFRIAGGNSGPLALTVLYAYRELERMWTCYNIVEIVISRTIAAMKKNSKSDVGVIVSEAMDKFLITFAKLHANNAWNTKGSDFPACVSNEWPFLGRLLSSHLQTGCCSLVLADSEAQANRTMQLLMPFVPAEERAIAFCCVPDKKWSYCPGITVQALIKDKFGEASVWVQQMLQNPHPTTIVDVGGKKVRQLLHSSATSQCSWQHGDEETTRHANALQPNALYTKKCNLKSVSQSGRLVSDFLKDLYMLDQGQRETYSKLFLRHLAIKSGVAIRVADHLRETSSGIQCSDLKTHLGLADTLDLRVVLGSAQKLHPDATSWK